MEQVPSNAPIMESKPGPAGWLQTWMKVVTKPGEQTFTEILNAPEAQAKTAYLWLFISGTLSGIIQAFASAIGRATGAATSFPIPGMEGFVQQSAPSSTIIGVLIGGICSAPLVGLISLVIISIIVAFTQWVAKLFGGTGSFDKLIYAYAAISVPFTLISSLLTLFGSIPYVVYCTGIISILVAFYVVYLNVTAVKAVNQFGWGQAIGSVFIPAIVIGLFCGCLVFFGTMALMPVISETYGQFN